MQVLEKAWKSWGWFSCAKEGVCYLGGWWGFLGGLWDGFILPSLLL